MKKFFTFTFSLVSLLVNNIAVANLYPSAHHYIPHHQSMERTVALAQFDTLILLMQKRLAIMHEVARWKWNHHLSVDDLIDGELTAEQFIQTAQVYGVPAFFAEYFIQSQIDAAKLIQARDFETWITENHGPFDKVCDLHTELTPYIESLNLELIEILGKISPFIQENTPCCGLTPAPLSRRSSDIIPADAWKKAVLPFSNCDL